MNKIFELALIEAVERIELTRIIQTLSSNAVIVEVGTFMGGSAAIMSTALPTAEIHCFDPFETDRLKNYNSQLQSKQYNTFFELLGYRGPRSIENVAAILEDYSNIHLYKRHSPNNIIWDRPVDLYFEDGVHRDPTLSRNIDFWSQYIKKSGYIVLHDHRPWLEINNQYRYPDIELAYTRLLSSGYQLVSKVRSLTVLQKTQE